MVINKVMITLLILSAVIPSNAQLYQSSSFMEPATPENNITIGMDKLINTYLFTISSNINFPLFSGRLKANQGYHGTALKTSGISYRDDEVWSIEYSYPLSSYLDGVLRQNWIYTTDTRSIGLNNLNRLNGNGGLKLKYNEISFLEFTAGVERNRQVGVPSTGAIMNLRGNISSFELLGLSFNSSIFGEYLKLDMDRLNGDLDFKIDSRKYYDSLNQLSFNFKYKLLNRDFVSPLQSTITNFIPIESRLEKRLSGDAGLDFALAPFLRTRIQASYSSGTIDRSYKSQAYDILSSKITRYLNESAYSASGELKLVLKNFFQSVTMAFDSRSEKNDVFKKFDISSEDLKTLSLSDNQRDNISGRTRLAAFTSILPTSNDSLKLNYAMSLLQYDTPSELNYDDRDELSYFANLSYGKYLSNKLSASVLLETQLVHVVFLRSQRSASNNWNRMIRFAPDIHYNSNSLKLNPQFEVLANYTVYDYEDVSPGIKSFSLRQTGYKDSIFIYLGNNFNLQTRLIFRYFERGILYWNNFSESPQNSNFEQFIKSLLFIDISSNWSVGCGARYYSLRQKNITSGVSVLSSNEYYQYSWGPESVILIKFYSGSAVSLHGWFEYQTINNVKRSPIPNLYIMTTYRF